MERFCLDGCRSVSWTDRTNRSHGGSRANGANWLYWVNRSHGRSRPNRPNRFDGSDWATR